MRKMTPIALLAALLALYGVSFDAQSKGGGGPAGGSQGAANGNSPSSPNRATGFDRAQQRMSDQGMEHQKATEARKKKGAPDDRSSRAATPATPATRAVPGNQTSPATPAVPATPASPANQ